MENPTPWGHSRHKEIEDTWTPKKPEDRCPESPKGLTHLYYPAEQGGRCRLCGAVGPLTPLEGFEFDPWDTRYPFPS